MTASPTFSLKIRSGPTLNTFQHTSWVPQKHLDSEAASPAGCTTRTLWGHLDDWPYDCSDSVVPVAIATPPQEDYQIVDYLL